MDENQKKKLEMLLNQRSKKIKSLQNFDLYFEEFSRVTLKKVIQNINEVLAPRTNENIRIFNDNPYEIIMSRYYIMVQLISDTHKRSTFLLDSTRGYPSLIFEGDEYNARVKITTKIRDKNAVSEVEITALTEGFTYDLVISFIDNVYKS